MFRQVDSMPCLALPCLASPYAPTSGTNTYSDGQRDENTVYIHRLRAKNYNPLVRVKSTGPLMPPANGCAKNQRSTLSTATFVKIPTRIEVDTGAILRGRHGEREQTARIPVTLIFQNSCLSARGHVQQPGRADTTRRTLEGAHRDGFLSSESV